MPYVVDGNFGVYTGNKPLKIASTVLNWFNSPEIINQMSRNAVNLGLCHSEATKVISKDIGKMLFNPDERR